MAQSVAKTPKGRQAAARRPAARADQDGQAEAFEKQVASEKKRGAQARARAAVLGGRRREAAPWRHGGSPASAAAQMGTP